MENTLRGQIDHLRAAEASAVTRAEELARQQSNLEETVSCLNRKLEDVSHQRNLANEKYVTECCSRMYLTTLSPQATASQRSYGG